MTESQIEDLYEYRCDERLRTKCEGSTRLTYTGLCGVLEHIKIETRLNDERFESVKGEKETKEKIQCCLL